MVVLLVCRMNCLLTVARCTVGGVDAPRNVATCQQQALRKKITSKWSGIAMMYFCWLTWTLASLWYPQQKAYKMFSTFLGLALKISSASNTSLWNLHMLLNKIILELILSFKLSQFGILVACFILPVLSPASLTYQPTLLTWSHSRVSLPINLVYIYSSLTDTPYDTLQCLHMDWFLVANPACLIPCKLTYI